MSDESAVASIETRIAANRSELERTLDAIEDKLDVPKRVGKLTARAQASFEQNPVPWKAGAIAAAIVIGGIVAWAIFGED